ncbi:CPBP family intramembrane metalloprotease [Solihabitans fulvus]|uniref:CPBP family intramembrane metalloprotease n=1 Tax=Solihabitans fulvus TaxID=1892852 RepID=A0A5B2XCE4_9PSEU|nr:CPBP family intramembrane glutamic endopeptidase [Solihabitans fulvus]KAA2260730.1 CPBP family intramembrane metalloprotease [Solihabitans fulvus]
MDEQGQPGTPPLAEPARAAAHWGFAAFFAGIGGYYLVTLVLTATLPGRFTQFESAGRPVLGPLLLLAFLPNLFLGLGPLVASWWKGAGPARDFGLLPTWRDVRVGLACGGFSLFAGWSIGVLLYLVHDGAVGGSPLDDLGALAGGRSVWLALAALFLLLGAPLTEELLVRGALWGALAHYRVPRLAILALTALIFAFLHEESWRTLSLFAQGVAIGWARMTTGRVGASLVAHGANNLLPAVYLFFSVS